MNEKIRRQMIYTLSVDILRRWLNDGKVEKSVLDRLNQKNAETMGCSLIPV